MTNLDYFTSKFFWYTFNHSNLFRLLLFFSYHPMLRQIFCLILIDCTTIIPGFSLQIRLNFWKTMQKTCGNEQFLDILLTCEGKIKIIFCTFCSQLLILTKYSIVFIFLQIAKKEKLMGSFATNSNMVGILENLFKRIILFVTFLL